MIQDFVKAWDANQDNLKEYFQTHEMADYRAYKDLVKLLFELVINPYLKIIGKKVYNLEHIHEIDDGDYQGTLLYAIPLDTFQPTEWDYVFTHQDYGSCPGCDILEEIQTYNYHQFPNKEQLFGHMTLCLHLLQKCIIPFSFGSQNEDGSAKS